MKKNKLFIGLMLSAALITGTSCEKSGDISIGEVEGTYIGIFSQSTDLKSALIEDGEGNHGVAEVEDMGDGKIMVHCYGDDIDTTIILDVYANDEEFLVCLTGTDFQNEYGHAQGGRHMGHMSSSQTEWMHHMEDDHEDNDEHFGGFNMMDETFSYSFRMMDSSAPYYLTFEGTKE